MNPEIYVVRFREKGGRGGCYLGSLGANHLTVDAGRARAFATEREAAAEIDRLRSTPGHFPNAGPYRAAAVSLGP